MTVRLVVFNLFEQGLKIIFLHYCYAQSEDYPEIVEFANKAFGKRYRCA